uniref:Acidic phospholipase A2 CC-PLA2-1 n=1 Tax=Cerastes cerastes TaxID=8697 RepID=PA2A1_CERCE
MRTLWIVAVWLMGVEGNLYQFGKMIKHKTGKSALLSYSAYGCYCGWGGQGKPQDATDHCCFVHDCCYGEVSGCYPKTAFTLKFENQDIICGDEDPCNRAVCECDRVAAICFGENVNTSDKKYLFYSSSYCEEESEQC